MALLLLGAIGIAAPLAVSMAAGSFGLPSVDDWSYRRVAAGFLSSGHLHYGGWVSMTLVGQVLWSWPFLAVFGSHGWVFGIPTMLLAMAGIGSAYWLARTVLPPVRAVAAVLVLMAGPGFALDTSTFMTDVPAISCELVSLALGLACLQRSGRSRAVLFTASMAVGIFGFSIREFDIAGPAAVVVCAAVGWRGRPRLWSMLAGAITFLVCGLIYEWSLTVPGLWKLSLGLPSSGSLHRLVAAYFLLAFCVSPAVAWAARGGLSLRRLRGPLAAAAVVVIGVVADRGQGLFVGNDIEPRGIAGTLLLGGGRPILVGSWLWHLVIVVGVLAGALLAWLAVDHGLGGVRRAYRRPWTEPLAFIQVFCALVGAGFFVYVLVAPKIFDRYFWALNFAVAVLLLTGRAARRRSAAAVRTGGVAAAAASVLVALVAVVLTVNSDFYDAARWQAGQLAVSRGVPASSVDAGFEWVGAHASGPVDLALQARGGPSWEPWYALMEPGFRDCAVVSGSPLVNPALKPLGTVRYEQLGLADPAQLYVYRSTAPGC